jgi:hypothetical protein
MSRAKRSGSSGGERELPGIGPGPLPTNAVWDTAELRHPDGRVERFVVLTFQTPQGTSTYFFPPENALALGAGIVAKARSIESLPPNAAGGIIVPEVDVAKVLRAIENGDPA